MNPYLEIMNVLVIGASENEERYSNRAVKMLFGYGHTVFAIGNRVGEIQKVKIQKDKIQFENIDTITLYLNAKNQESYHDYILGLNPKRVIFNPGAENPKLEKMLAEKGIHFEEACTLVMLRANQF